MTRCPGWDDLLVILLIVGTPETATVRLQLNGR